MMRKLIVLGSLNMDLVARAAHIPTAGETILGSDFFQSPGGKGANQACAIASLGAPVAMLGRVGDDEFGRQMRTGLETAGCGVAAVRSVPGPSGIALIVVSDSGENSIVVAPGANAKFTPQDLTADLALLDGAHALLLQLETPLDTVIRAAAEAQRRNVRVILDPAPAPEAGLPLELLQAVDILTPNETEAGLLTHRPATKMTPDAALSIARELLSQGPRAIVLKLGARGCLVLDAAGPLFVPAPKVNAVDTTAAGDIFNGAMAVGLSEGKSLADACWFAAQAASLSVTRHGAQRSAPTRLEVDQFAASLRPA